MIVFRAILVACFLVFWKLHPAHTKLEPTAPVVEVVSGEKTQIICTSTDRKSIAWRHKPLGSTSVQDIYVGGNLQKPYAEKCAVEMNTQTGQISLLLSVTTAADAGTYTCLEEGESGDESLVELVVLKSRPKCEANEAVVGEDCRVPSTDIRVSCSVEFSGNVPPEIECIDMTKGAVQSPTDSSSKKIAESTRSVSYVFTKAASFSMNRQQILCRTTISHVDANPVRAHVAYVLDTSSYIVIDRPRMFQCVANSSQPCDYYWIEQDDDEVPLYEQSIEISFPGYYQCVAGCVLADKLCTVRPLFVEYRSDKVAPRPATGHVTWMHTSKKVTVIVLCVVVGFFVIAAVGIAFACAYRRLIKPFDASPAIHFLWKLSTEESMIQGVALLNRCVYLVHRGQNFVSVYDANSPDKFIGKIILEGLQNPRDIAACSQNSCLYITDAGQNCIWKIQVGSTMEDKTTKISIWVAKVNDPHTVSVISGGRVLIVQPPNTLRIYRSDGTIFRTTQIKGDFEEPQHAIRTQKGTFIVSHGSKYDKEHRVLEVSAKGNILQSFGNKRGEKDSIRVGDPSNAAVRLSHPRHLAIDRTGRSLVVDRKNNRVIRLDKNLDLVEMFPCPGMDKAPVRLCCDERRLLVARGNAVFFYTVDYDDDRNIGGSEQRKTEEEDEDSDDYTDDVPTPKRTFPETPLLANQFPVRKQAQFSQSFSGENSSRGRKI